MKASLRLTLLIITSIIVIFMVIPVFLTGNITVEASTEIKASPEVVYNEVNVLRNWKKWSPFETDSTMVNKYEGQAAGTGARRSWTSKHNGNGKIMITKSEPDSLIETKMDFGAPGAAAGRWTFSDKQGKTLVRWQLQIQRLQYPFGRWMGLLLKKMMTPVLENGLSKLKSIAEKQKSVSGTLRKTP